jgi:hypothetical protein
LMFAILRHSCETYLHVMAHKFIAVHVD